MKPAAWMCPVCDIDKPSFRHAGMTDGICFHSGDNGLRLVNVDMPLFTRADLVAVARQCLGWTISASDGLDVTAERIVAEMLDEVES